MPLAPASLQRQRGAALLGLVAVIVMVFAYVVTSRLNAASRFVATDREHNARVLNRAKLAVIGYALQTAYDFTERNPGRLPCPEAPGNYGTANEGIAAGNCSVPAVGRLPWRTLGIEKLVDASGQPLWYVVSPGWAPPTSTSTLTINADTVGQLTVDGANAMALVIAPGPAIVVQTASGCTAYSQQRPTAPGTLDKRDYLECGNEANNFVSSAPGKTFNDQVMRITPVEIMPGLEAAIQQRAQDVIAPALRSAAFELDTNSPRRWISTAPLPSSSTPPIYPYPVPFTNPTTSVSNFRGATGTNQGLLPFASASSTVAYQSTPANVIKTSSNGKVANIVCGFETSTMYTCTGDYEEQDKTLDITVQMTATYTNAAMGLRARNTGALQAHARNDDGVSSWSTTSVSTSKRLEMNDGGTSGKPRGSVTATLSVTLPNHQAMGWGKWAEFRLRMNSTVIADHPLLSDTGRAVYFTNGTSAISNGNTVTGATSGASGAVQVLVNSGSWSSGNATGMLFFSSVSGAFQNGETLQVSGSSKAKAMGADFDIGWFVRNEWYRNFYYAVAQQNTPDVLPGTGGCTKSSGNCLKVRDPVIAASDSDRNIRALLVLAGRGLGTQSRPSSSLSNYLEFENADTGTVYEQRTMRDSRFAMSPSTTPPYAIYAPWNDRLVLVDGFSTVPYPNFPYTPAPIAVQW